MTSKSVNGWQCWRPSEGQMLVAVTGTLAGVAVCALPPCALWCGAAVLVALSLQSRLAVRSGATDRLIRLVANYTLVHLAALFFGVAFLAARRPLSAGEVVQFAVIPSFLFFLVHAAGVEGCVILVEKRGLRALMHNLPWVYFIAWLVATLFICPVR